MATDVRELVPAVRRAVEGVGVPATLSDDDVKDLVADAIADILLYTRGAFGHELLVAERDSTSNAPTEYETAEPLTLEETAVVRAQAALSYFIHDARTRKVSETIRDEGQEWSYQLSANALTDQLRQLRQLRDDAIAALEAANNPLPVAFISLLHERDRQIAEIVEPLSLGA